MFEVINETPFKTLAVPLVCHEDNNHAALIIKGTFNLNRNKSVVSLSEEQVDVFAEDQYWGEPDSSSPKYESDITHKRTSTNVILVGSAWSDKRTVNNLDVGIKLGSLSKVIKVFGDRYWEKAGQFWRISSPEFFEKMPLVYENAYGGVDSTHQNPKLPGFEPRNPVGKGFIINANNDSLLGLPLPNLEYSNQLIKNWRDRPNPACFGITARHWLPRKSLAGTYDDQWLKQRNPLLPKDFDVRFYDCASDGMKTEKYLSGGEALQVVNANANGPVDCLLPSIKFKVESSVDGKNELHTTQLDTVVVEPDENRVTLCWRVAFQCHWNLAKVEWLKVGVERSNVGQ